MPNIHPFFVHAPLVLIPLTALFVVLTRFIRRDGFELAALLINAGAALAAIAAMWTGYVAKDSVTANPAFAELLTQHQINGSILPGIITVVAALSFAQWRGWLKGWAFWLRLALLIWATVGTFYGGHSDCSDQLLVVPEPDQAVAESGQLSLGLVNPTERESPPTYPACSIA